MIYAGVIILCNDNCKDPSRMATHYNFFFVSFVYFVVKILLNSTHMYTEKNER
jgi:hypothetical protein